MKMFPPNTNVFIGCGRLTADAELHTTKGGTKLARFTLAVNKRYKDSKSGEYKEKPSFIPMVIWNGLSERILPRLKKGTAAEVQGEVNSRNYETKDGQKRTALEVTVNHIQVLSFDDTHAAQAAEAGHSDVPTEEVVHDQAAV